MDHTTAIRRFYDLISAGDIDGFSHEVADDFVEHEEVRGFAPTKAGVVEYFRMLLAAFPDMHMAAEDVMACGDKVVARVVVTCPALDASQRRAEARRASVRRGAAPPSNTARSRSTE
ncbi:MAG: ester cyclase [Acidobacteria bacterium]|nr:ester cyclase [Acidobacteriota bacterium]